MSLRTSATRYAKALFDVALREADPATFERDLATLTGTVEGHAALRRAVTSPGVPRAARLSLVTAIADRVGVAAPVAKLARLLAERGRVELLPLILDVYRERVLVHRGVVRAQVTSAAPLSETQVRELRGHLGALTGKNVELDTAVDSEMIGGVITRIGSTVYDGSIRTQLQKMKAQLVESA